ncbi:hypothetical protein HELRODRAFT_179073 [Helobdella robusta]|uniref:Uncharacterized protein n=1 Tax=Helobdella robusta TaxID=6412 RepID=T1FE54_HELRO|nr:hypothetical protein HELRODRAFT_179073 [Helobdella robusta]ESN95619.1 hypothetical protein HELRODRAFT_179073 [Helobdella robusta]
MYCNNEINKKFNCFERESYKSISKSKESYTNISNFKSLENVSLNDSSEFDDTQNHLGVISFEEELDNILENSGASSVEIQKNNSSDNFTAYNAKKYSGKFCDQLFTPTPSKFESKRIGNTCKESVLHYNIIHNDNNEHEIKNILLNSNNGKIKNCCKTNTVNRNVDNSFDGVHLNCLNNTNDEKTTNLCPMYKLTPEKFREISRWADQTIIDIDQNDSVKSKAFEMTKINYISSQNYTETKSVKNLSSRDVQDRNIPLMK